MFQNMNTAAKNINFMLIDWRKILFCKEVLFKERVREGEGEREEDNDTEYGGNEI